ncbi:hypothetical protein D3C72_1577790 [compost metagenome]
MHQQVAGHFEQEVADEEQPGAEAEYGFRELQVLGHLQLGEAHVHAIEVGDHVAEHQERHDAPEHLLVGAFLDHGVGVEPAAGGNGGRAGRRVGSIHV